MSLREMILAASARTDLERAGSHLETRQRLGILPTMAFWSRRDVWRHGRWFAAPGFALTVSVVSFVVGSIPHWLDRPLGLIWIWAPVLGVGLSSLWLGFIERIVRKGVKARAAGLLRGERPGDSEDSPTPS